MEYKIGDTVRRIGEFKTYGNLRKGSVFEIKQIDNVTKCGGVVDENDQFHYFRNIELISPAGDKETPPKYWYILLTKENKDDVIGYLNKIHTSGHWDGILGEYYGYDDNSEYQGTNAHGCSSDFENNAVEITYGQFKRYFMGGGSFSPKSEDIKAPFDIDNFCVKRTSDERWKDFIDYINERFSASVKGALYPYYGVRRGGYECRCDYPWDNTISLDTFFNYINNKNNRNEVHQINQQGLNESSEGAIRRPKCKRSIAIGSIPHQNEIRGKRRRKKVIRGEVEFSTIRF